MNPSTINQDTPVGHIAARRPLATRVFARHGIDFCCGGGEPLSGVCERRGLDPTAVLREIDEAVEDPAGDPTDWTSAPLDDLIGHIESVYHASLREELPRLESMTRKVVRVHGDKRPGGLPELLRTLLRLRDELTDHMAKEEQILFPMIRRGMGSRVAAPVAVMEHEHASAGKALQDVRRLTDDFEVPPEACNTWAALWHGLAALERDLHRHIHLENNILFPRALGGSVT